MHVLILTCGCLLFWIAPVKASTATEATAPAQKERLFAGLWEHRFGDSPRDENGTLVWTKADPATNAPSGWSRPAPNMMPSGRGAHQFLWLRTTLTGPPSERPALYLTSVYQLFEAYLDGHLLYRYGQLSGDTPPARRFRGYSSHLIPLPSDYSGKRLTLRIFSNYITLGVSGNVYIGDSYAILAKVLRQDMVKIAVGIILGAIGIFTLILFGLQRKQVAYFFYGCFALGTGVWILCQMGCRTILYNAPLVWSTVEIFSLYLTVPCLLRFIYQIFGRGPFGLVPVLVYIFAGYAVGAALAVGFGVVTLLMTLLPFQIMMLLGISYTLAMITHAVYRGNTEARLFAVGFMAVGLFAAYDVLAVMGVLPRTQVKLSCFGHAIFVLSLGVILGHRIRRDHLDLVAVRRELSNQLAEIQRRNVEVQQLNDDLRRQIEARSKHLVHSLLDSDSQSSDAVSPVLPDGTLIAERYEIVRLIGQGGMGTVYEVVRRTDGRSLAAKVLSGHAGKKALARFAREAQLLARLKHDHLVTIFDVDITDAHMAYIIMELIRGRNLAALGSRYGELGFARVVLMQIADALAAVHAQGIVHREVLLIDMDCLRCSRKPSQRRRQHHEDLHRKHRSHIPLACRIRRPRLLPACFRR